MKKIKYLKLNQKGLAWIPLTEGFVVVLLLGSLVAGSGYLFASFIDNLSHPQKSVNTESSSNVLSATSQSTPLPSPTYTPVPTQKPVVNNQQTNNQQNTNNQAQATGDGPTRTGKIIKYKEYCKGGQEISVYENELITKKASDGNTYSMTKDDWICSENSAKNQQNQAGQNNTTSNNNPQPQVVSEPPNNTQPLITCVVNYPCTGNSYTYQLDQGNCNIVQQNAANICRNSTKYTPINCSIDTYCNGSPITYQFDQATCDKMQKSQSEWCQLKQASAKSTQQFNSIPQPTPFIFQQAPSEGFDTGMMCERKFDGYNFIGGCI